MHLGKWQFYVVQELFRLASESDSNPFKYAIGIFTSKVTPEVKAVPDLNIISYISRYYFQNIN